MNRLTLSLSLVLVLVSVTQAEDKKDDKKPVLFDMQEYANTLLGLDTAFPNNKPDFETWMERLAKLHPKYEGKQVTLTAKVTDWKLTTTSVSPTPSGHRQLYRGHGRGRKKETPFTLNSSSSSRTIRKPSELTKPRN